MITKKTLLKALFLLCFIFTTLQTTAQPPVFDDDIEDETDLPAAPIDSYLVYALLTGAALGSWYIVKQNKLKQQK